jgi:hypothetical protein
MSDWIEVVAGSQTTFPLTIRDTANGNALYDPATLAFRIRAPGGTVTEYAYPGASIVRDSAGVYHADVVLEDPGVTGWSWHIGGPSPRVVHGQVLVLKVATG